MSFIETITPSVATDETRGMYLRQQKHYGYVPNYAKVFSHRPEIMPLWASLQRGIRKNMSDRSFELTTLAAALTLGSTNCALAHGTQLAEFFSTAELKAIINNKAVQLGIITDAEATMINFAKKVARDASSIIQADIDILKTAGFSDAQVFDITAAAAARAFFTKVIDGLGSATDHNYPQMDHELRQMLSAGRSPVTCAVEVCPTE
jgi:uncharacterized peroxidase-related enzyme